MELLSETQLCQMRDMKWCCSANNVLLTTNSSSGSKLLRLGLLYLKSNSLTKRNASSQGTHKFASSAFNKSSNTWIALTSHVPQ